MIGAAFDLALCGLIIATAFATVASHAFLTAAIFFIVYGVFIAIAWLRLEAIDVALAEAAIGAGLTGLLLIGAIPRLPVETASPRAGAPRGAVALASAVVGASVAAAYLALPPPNGLQQAVAQRLAQSGVENPVTAVLLNFRAWDTLIESVVLAAALFGVWSLAADDSWGGPPGLPQHVRPGGVLASFGRVLPPVGFLVAVYLVWAGGKQPGGAFQGGTLLAAVALLVAMAGLVAPPRTDDRRLRVAVVAGPALFLAVGVIGAFADGFLVLPPTYAKTLIVGIEAALALSIAATLALLVLGRPER